MSSRHDRPEPDAPQREAGERPAPSPTAQPDGDPEQTWDVGVGVTTGLAGAGVAVLIGLGLGGSPVVLAVSGLVGGGLIGLLSAYRPLHEPGAAPPREPQA